MRKGRVYIEFGYNVDLDDQDMVQHAIESIHDDIMSYIKYDEDPNQLVSTRDLVEGEDSDIASFLTESVDDE
jgi:hypothetical protein